MNYELAKQLKDAGFDQALGFGSWYYDDEGITLLPFGGNNIPTASQYVHCPTLEELITACGYDFDHLKRWENNWGAYAYTCFHVSKTPTEAVAMLYLALHGKKQNNKDAGETSRVEGR